jgi:putative hydrolase
MKLLLAACLKNGCHIALDTDAHSTTQLQGNMPPLLAMLEEMQFPQELVVNATRQNLVNELKLHGRICAEYIGGEIL